MLIRNHNGLIGRYPGADGMKTGFTCPAGWNLVATAERNGRKLIVVVFGSASPRMRNNEAVMLFDRGFAMSPSGEKLESLPASAVTSPPDMRDEICRGRGRAAMLAMEEDFIASAMADAPTSLGPGRGVGAAAPMMSGSMEAPPHAADINTERVAFDPVPVFVGPKPGWTGPILAARDSDAAEPEPSPVSAFADKQAKPDAEGGAPMALKSAVKPPIKHRRAHLTPQARARFAAAAARRVARKSHHP